MRVRLCLMFFALYVLSTGSALAQDAASSSSGMDDPSKKTAPGEKPPRIRLSAEVASSNVLHTVPPIYPPTAKTAQISGTVILRCIIGRDGTTQQIQYVSGPPLLMKAAIDAVRQWTYKPMSLNGRPVEVDTTVSVIFQPETSSSKDAPVEVTPAVPEKPLSSDAYSIAGEPSPSSIDPQFKADILRLMEVTHTKSKQEEVMRTFFDSLRPQMLREFPPTPNREKILDAYLDKLIALVQTDDFTNRTVSAYANRLTDDDAKAAVAFYETPAGQRYLESSQKLIPDMMELGRHLVTEKLAGVFQDLCKQFPELQGEAKFCKTADPTKKSLLLGAGSFPLGN